MMARAKSEGHVKTNFQSGETSKTWAAGSSIGDCCNETNESGTRPATNDAGLVPLS
jgi:hypothetical protein